MAIECENCNGQDFHVVDGATFCRNCNTESQEHGQETVVDEETLGAYGDHAGSIRSKSIGKRRKSKSKSSKDKHKLSYTSLSIFTYILKGWIQDAINELGVGVELENIVFALWVQYLAKIELAFVKKPTLSKKPGFRDTQVKITQRKKLLTPTKIGNFVRKLKDPSHSNQREEIDYYSEESAEIRRKRNKAKRKFLESIASNISSKSGDESVMSASNISSMSEPDSMDESLDETINENDPDVEESHMHVLSRCTSPKISIGVKKSPEVVRKKAVFAIFCLGVLLMDDNKYSLCDLIRFAKNGVISYDTSSQHVPPVVKLKENFDLAQHTGLWSHLSPLDHLRQRRCMGRIGKY